MCKLCRGSGYIMGAPCTCNEEPSSLYNEFTCRKCGSKWGEFNLTIRADETECMKCQSTDISISNHALSPTKQDASDEDAVYEWPDGTWCWQYELQEHLTWMSDDYALVWFDPSKHI